MDLSLGSARPMLAAMRRCGSLVEFSLMTVNATWPGLMCFKPSLREISLQYGGKIEETRTILQAAIPALRNASSKLDRRPRCFPPPLVRKIFFATNAMSSTELRCLHCAQRKNFRAQRKLTSTRTDVNLFQHCNVTTCDGCAHEESTLLQFR